MGRAEDLFQKIKTDKIKAINEFIADRQREELFLDFKRSSDNGERSKLSDYDRNNLGKAITGFGNSEGGLLIWGIECSKKSDDEDVARAKFPIVNAKRFASLIEGAISGVTIPPHTKVENFVVENKNSKEGFVITLIPQNQGLPLQDINKKYFYIRAGSSFLPAPYQVIAGMFGKRPQPNVYNMYTFGPATINQADNEIINTQIGFMLHNEGVGVAKDIFLNVRIWTHPGPNCQISFETTDTKNWGGSFNFGRFMYLISLPGLRLAPDSEAQPLIMNTTFKPPFTDDLHIKITAGCSGGPIYRGSLRTKKEKIIETYNKYISLVGSWDTKTGHKITQSLIQGE